MVEQQILNLTVVGSKPATPTMKTYPHCDANVLHARGECKYCDKHPLEQLKRIFNKINFTGRHDLTKSTCPSELGRDLESIEKWGGNVPVPKGMTTILWRPELVTEEEADAFYANLHLR